MEDTIRLMLENAEDRIKVFQDMEVEYAAECCEAYLLLGVAMREACGEILHISAQEREEHALHRVLSFANTPVRQLDPLDQARLTSWLRILKELHSC